MDLHSRDEDEWERVRLRCEVIGLVLANLVTVQVGTDARLEDDDAVTAWSWVGARLQILAGKPLNLVRSRVPSRWCTPNASFWIGLTRDEAIAFYAQEDDLEPLSTVPFREAFG